MVTNLYASLLRNNNSVVLYRLAQNVTTYVCLPDPPPSVWPHLFCGACHEKRRGEQLKWSLAFRLYIGSFPCAQDQFIYSPVGRSVCVFLTYLA